MDPSTSDVQSLIAGLFGLVFLFFALIAWVVQGFAFYKMFTKANVANPWLAFIPIGNFWPYMATIKKSAWNILWLLVPIANAVFLIIWTVRLFKAFNINPLWALLFIGSILPFISYMVSITFLVLYCYMGFSSTVRYNPNFDRNNPTPPPAAM
jgi:hypothetical protein